MTQPPTPNFASAGRTTPQQGERRRLLRQADILADRPLTPEAIEKGVALCRGALLSESEIDRVFPERVR
jgi:hypothetical protein